MGKLATAAVLAGIVAAAVVGTATGGQTQLPTAYTESAPSVRDAPPGARFTTVATLRVPTGSYVVNAKTVVITNATTGGDCNLYAGTRFLDGSTQPLVNTSATARATYVVQYAGLVSGSAPLRLRCRAGVGWFTLDSKITAIRAAVVAR